MISIIPTYAVIIPQQKHKVNNSCELAIRARTDALCISEPRYYRQVIGTARDGSRWVREAPLRATLSSIRLTPVKPEASAARPGQRGELQFQVTNEGRYQRTFNLQATDDLGSVINVIQFVHICHRVITLKLRLIVYHSANNREIYLRTMRYLPETSRKVQIWLLLLPCF